MSVLDVLNQRVGAKVRKMVRIKSSYLIIIPKAILSENFVRKGYRMTILSLSADEIILKLRVANGTDGEYNKDNKECGEDA